MFTIEAQVPAFPGAEGFGKYATGGRGGKVYFVDNLNDSGPGSFRAAAQASGPRYIIFRVGGTINLKSPISVKKDATIAGQTAPGDGITTRNYPIRLADRGNYIVRGLRSRIGDDARGNVGSVSDDNTDAFQIEGTVGADIIVDHCSFTWGTDESISIVSRNVGSTKITVQNCLIAETLLPHSLAFMAMGWKNFGVGPVNVSFIKNYIANNKGRNGQFGNLVTGEICNNVVYNWGGSAMRLDAGAVANLVGNYYKAGPSTTVDREVKITKNYEDGPTKLYVKGNIGPNRPSNSLPQNALVFLAGGAVNISGSPVINSYESSYLSAFEARDYVLENAGALPRDAIDQRIVNQFYSNKGKIIADEDEVGGFKTTKGGSYPNDSDNDGMPDSWEAANNLNPNVKDHNGDKDGDGYTNIEEYINSIYEGGSPPPPPTNTAPTISNISDKTIDQDQTLGPLGFTVGDAETSAGQLQVSGKSSNQSLVKDGNIKFGGSGKDRTVEVTPESGATGTATVTITVSDGDLSDSESFKLTVNATAPTNTAPTISNISDKTIDQDQTLGPLGFTVGDAETSAGQLQVSGKSSNQSLVKDGNIKFGGSGKDRTVEVTPESGATGTATVTITVSDGDLSDSESFKLTVNATAPTNTAPTISNISDKTIDQDQTLGPLGFTVGDAETSAGQLQVSGKSSNQSLVKDGNIKFGGSGKDRTVEVTPESGATGTATVTITVSDGDLSDSESFKLTVNATAPTNTAPTISNISDKTIDQDQTLGPLGFTVGDAETSAGQLQVSGKSSNQSLVKDGNIKFGGSGKDRTVEVTPESGATGTATVTITVSDGDLSDSESFKLTVNATAPTNTAPTISNISDKTIDQDQTLGPLGFTVGDAETSAGQLQVSGKSSNQSLVKDGNIKFGGSGKDRTVEVTPESGATGTATVTITVSDGDLSDSESFKLTVNATAPTNTAPTISNISDKTIDQDQTLGPLGFTVGDAETSAGQLQVSGKSSNQSLVKDGNIKFGGSGKDRTVEVTPESGATGTATVTITVSDGDLSDSESFKLTVNATAPTNTAPTISNISDKTIDQDQTLGPLGFTVGDAETSAGQLQVSGKSSNQSLVKDGNIKFGGSGKDRTVEVTPESGATGTATVTITVSDGDLSDSESFKLTVNATAPTNTAPTISNISDKTIDQDQTLGPLGFTVGDAETSAGQLQVSGKSSNQSLVKDGNIKFGGNGKDRTVEVTPESGATGTATVTITVSDGDLSDSESFKLTINATAPTNTAPTISNIPNFRIEQGQALGPIDFTINDIETPGDQLQVSAKSSIPSIISNNGIHIGGSGSNRNIRIVPAEGQFGMVQITLTVSDGDLVGSEKFSVEVQELVRSSPIGLSFSYEPITCNGASNGTAEVLVSGGVPPFDYKWSTGAVSSKIENLRPGTYNVSVTDASGNSVNSSVTIDEPTQIAIDATVQDESCLGGDGLVSLSVSGGSGGYTFRWSDGSTTKNLDNLTSGLYVVTVTDFNGCSIEKEFTIEYHSGPDKPIVEQDGNVLTGPKSATYQWYKDGKKIIDATDQTFEINESANYSLVIGDSGRMFVRVRNGLLRL